MLHLETSVEINAPASKVWDVFADFASYGDWNPFIIEAAGEMKSGARLRVAIQPKDSKPMTFKPKVTKLVEGSEFEWLGRFILPRIFDGQHYFKIEPIDDNRCRFIQGEYFRGILVPLMRKMLETKTKPGFEAMNQALKIRAEA